MIDFINRSTDIEGGLAWLGQLITLYQTVFWTFEIGALVLVVILGWHQNWYYRWALLLLCFVVGVAGMALGALKYID
jgi:hypothetical protein